MVYGTASMRKKLADFYESGIKPVLADVVNEGGTLGTAFLRSFGKLPLVSDRLGQFMKEQGPIVRDKVDRMIEAGRGRTLSNRDREILGETGRTISNMDRSYIDDILSSLEKKN